MNAIDCTHLTRAFGRTVALNDVTFSVPQGSFFALLGPNGAGKSTTLKILLNLLPPSSGEAMVLGKPSTSLRAKDFQRIGYIADGQDLPDWMTGTQLLTYCRSMYPKWDQDLVKRLSRDLRVPMDRPIKKLSRGQRMQVSLLSTLPFRPELLILDEPFSGLDPLVRDDLILGFLELPSDDRPGTIVVSSHDIDEVERLTDEVAFLSESRVLARESTVSLQKRFRSIEVTGTSALATEADPAWHEYREPTENVRRFIVADYCGPESEAEIARRFPDATLTSRPMTLRQIFIAIARRERLNAPALA